MPASKTICSLATGLGLAVSRSMGDELISTCPYCGSPGHLYLNTEKLVYICQGCGKFGDHIQLLAHTVETILDPVTRSQRRAVAKIRSLPSMAFKNCDFRWSPKRRKYVLTIQDRAGRPVDIREFKPGQSFRSVSGGTTCMLGSEQLSDPDRVGEIVYVCEGEWDYFAFTHWLNLTGEPGLVVSVPGANTFKLEWARWLKERDCVVLYDNDDAGAKGELKVHAALNRSAKSVRYHRWPDKLPKGYDINDYVSVAFQEMPEKKNIDQVDTENRSTDRARIFKRALDIVNAESKGLSEVDRDWTSWQAFQERLHDDPRLPVTKAEPSEHNYFEPGTKTFIPIRVAVDVEDRFTSLTKVDGYYMDYMPETGIWLVIQLEEIERVIIELLGDKTTAHRLRDVIKILSAQITKPDRSCQPDRNTIPFTGGHFDPVTGNLLDHSPDRYHRHVLPFDYDSDAKCPLWDKVISTIFNGDKASIRLLHQCLGYGLVADNSFHRFFMFVGVGANGKSLVLDTFTALLGPDAVASIGLDSLNDRFALAPLEHTRANIVHEVNTSQHHRSSVLKELVTNGKKGIEEKYGPKRMVFLTAKHYYAANEPIMFKDSSGALQRRAVTLEFPRQFTPEEQDRQLSDKLLAELPGIFNRLVAGLRDLYDAGDFVLPARSIELAKQFARDQNHVLDFIEQCCELNADSRTHRPTLYRKYRAWHDTAGVPSKWVSDKEFYRRIHNMELPIKLLKTGGKHFYDGLSLIPAPPKKRGGRG